MKTLVVFALCFVCALAGLTDEQKAKLNEYKESCITETGVEASAVESAKSGNIPEGDQKLGCYAACMLKKIGIMNPDGSINEEVARAKAPQGASQEKIEEVITKCKAVGGADDCEKGGNVMKCVMENNLFETINN